MKNLTKASLLVEASARSRLQYNDMMLGRTNNERGNCLPFCKSKREGLSAIETTIEAHIISPFYFFFTSVLHVKARTH